MRTIEIEIEIYLGSSLYLDGWMDRQMIDG